MFKSICSLFKNYIFWVTFTAIYCVLFNALINALIVYLWSYLVNKLIPSSYSFIKYFIILILFFYNYFVLRKIVLSWTFEWQHPYQIFSIYKERQSYLNYLNGRLNEFIKAIEVLINNINSLPKIEVEFFDSFLYLFNDEYYIYNKLFMITRNNSNDNHLIRYKMSKCQITYYNLLKQINDILNKNNLKQYLLKNALKKDKSEKETSRTNSLIETDNSLDSSTNINSEILNQLIILLYKYKNIISQYSIVNYTFMSPSYLYNLIFNDTFGSLSLYSLQFKKNFENYILEENFTPKGKIHYVLIRNKKEKENVDYNINNINTKENNNLIIDDDSNNNLDDGPLLIFCLPNGACYELMPPSKINFYMENGFSFLVWNYNGYGYSKGTPNFSNIKAGILELYDIIVKNPKYRFKKICVMGHSIGGVPAFYLAKNRHVDLLISDRNFCDLPRIVNNWHCGSILNFLVKCLCIGNTDNINNYFNENLKDTYKIIIYSPIDTLILNDASVKSGISRYILKNYIIYKQRENNNIIRNKENILDIVFSNNEKEIFLNEFLELMNLHFYNNNDQNLNYDQDFLNNSYEEQDFYKQDYISNNNLKKGNLSQSETDILISFFGKFFGCCCDDLNILIKLNVSLRRQKIYINNFFNNLLIWGIQSSDKKNENELEFLSYKGRKTLKEANELLFEFISSIHEIDKTKNTLLIENISKNIRKILDVIDNLDIKFEGININYFQNIEDNKLEEKLISKSEEDINTNKIIEDSTNNTNPKSKNNFFNKLELIKGNVKLMKTYAGHNGFFRNDEFEQYYIFLLTSNVIS